MSVLDGMSGHSAPTSDGNAAPAAGVRRWFRLGAEAQARLLILVFPLTLLLVDKNWILPQPDTVDPWIYVGHFLAPATQVWKRGEQAPYPYAYHSGRLPIILPGALCCKLFKLPEALVVLHLALYYLAAFSLYSILRRFLRRRTALLTTLLAGGHAFFLSSMGLGHADAFGIAYALATIYFLTRACAGPGWRRPLFAAGACAALFLWTNVGYGPLLVAFPWLLCTLPRNVAAKRLWSGIPAVALGFLMVTGLLCIFSHALGGEWVFFGSSLNYVRETSGKTYPCPAPGVGWLAHASWLVFPALTLVALGLVARRRRELTPRQRIVLWSFGGAFVLTCVVMIACQLTHVLYYFQFSFYTSPLLPLMFLTAGALLAPFVEGWSKREFGVALAASVLLACLGVACVRGGDLTPLRVWALPLLIGLVACVVLARPDLLRNAPGVLLIVLLGVVNVLIGVHFDRFLRECPLERPLIPGRAFVGAWQDRIQDDPHITMGPSRGQCCRIVREAFRIMLIYDPRRAIRTWYAIDDPYGSLFTAIASTQYWDHRWASPHFPAAQDLLHEPVPLERGRVALLTREGGPGLAAAQATAEQHGLEIEVHLQRSFIDLGVPVTLSIIDLVPKAR